MAVHCTLGSADLSSYLRNTVRIGGALREWDEVGGVFADISRQVNVRSSDLIDIVIPLAVSAATADLLIAAIDTIRDELVKDTNTLVMHPTGATNEVTFNILKNPHLVPVWDGAYDVGKLALFDLVLVAEPWAYGAAVTSISAVSYTIPEPLSFKVSAGDAVTLLGDEAAPLTITLIPNADADIHNAYIGWYGTADWTGHLVETDTAGTWVGGTVADAALTYEHDGASCKNTSTSYAYYPIDTAAYTAGTYLVIARVALSNAAETGYLKLSNAAGDLTDEVAFDPDGTHWELVEIGTVRLPAADVSTGTAYLGVNMKMDAGDVGSIAMDYVGFVPIDNGLCAYHGSTDTTDASSLKWQWGKCYVENVCNFADAIGHGIKAKGNGTLVVFAEHVDPNAATYAGTITVSYTPRWHLWR